MRYIIFTLLILSVFLFSCNPEDIFESDLLTNNNLEIGNDQVPTGWYAVPGPYEVKWLDAEGYKSDRSIQITSDINSNEFGFWAQDIQDFETGKFVEMKVRIKKDDVKGAGLAFAIRGDSDLSNPSAEWFTTTQTDRTIIGNSGWQEYSLASESAIPNDMVSMTVYLIMLPQSKGTAYFDHISLEYVD